MEVIKTSSNVEFDVTYADGTRERVALRPEACALFAEFFAPMFSALTSGHDVRHLLAKTPNIVVIARPDINILHPSDKAGRQAIFRLGQMDMRESAAAKLRSAAVNVYGIARATLESAADLIDEMKTLDSDAGQEELNAET